MDDSLGTAGTANDPVFAAMESRKADKIAMRDTAQDNLNASIGKFDPASAIGPTPEFSEPVPADHFKDVMSQAPLLMALGAVGGVFGHAHGMAMLKTTNAMMSGMMKGSDEQYKRAREDYQEKYDNYKTKSKTWIDVYKAYTTAYKGQFDEQRRAFDAANAAVGEVQKEENAYQATVANRLKLSEQIDKQHDLVSKWNKDRPIAQQNADAHTTSANASASRAGTASSAETRKGEASGQSQRDSKQQANAVIDDLDKLLDEHSALTGVGGAARRAGEWVASATGAADESQLPATKFNSKIKLLETQVSKFLEIKGNRLNSNEKKKIEDAVEGFRMTSGAQQKVKLQELRNAINKTSDDDTKTINGVTYRRDPTASNGWRVQQ